MIYDSEVEELSQGCITLRKISPVICSLSGWRTEAAAPNFNVSHDTRAAQVLFEIMVSAPNTMPLS